MRTLLPLASSLALSALLLTAQAQTTPAKPATASQAKAAIQQRTINHRAATYKGPKIVTDTKKLGHEMLKDSKPVTSEPMRFPVSPVKQ